MQYADNSQIRLGDRVRHADGEDGEVVFSIDTDEYSSEFPKQEWEYLSEVIMSRTASGELFHYCSRDDAELILICRANEI